MLFQDNTGRGYDICIRATSLFAAAAAAARKSDHVDADTELRVIAYGPVVERRVRLRQIIDWYAKPSPTPEIAAAKEYVRQIWSP